jgi:cytoskeletal protein RodZ
MKSSLAKGLLFIRDVSIRRKSSKEDSKPPEAVPSSSASSPTTSSKGSSSESSDPGYESDPANNIVPVVDDDAKTDTADSKTASAAQQMPNILQKPVTMQLFAPIRVSLVFFLVRFL